MESRFGNSVTAILLCHGTTKIPLIPLIPTLEPLIDIAHPVALTTQPLSELSVPRQVREETLH